MLVKINITTHTFCSISSLGILVYPLSIHLGRIRKSRARTGPRDPYVQIIARKLLVGKFVFLEVEPGGG